MAYWRSLRLRINGCVKLEDEKDALFRSSVVSSALIEILGCEIGFLFLFESWKLVVGLPVSCFLQKNWVAPSSEAEECSDFGIWIYVLVGRLLAGLWLRRMRVSVSAQGTCFVRSNCGEGS